jgi:hypothetical protein
LINDLEAEDIGEGNPRWVLRILTPEAERFHRGSDEEIIGKYLKVLENKLQIKVKPFGSSSIKRM